MSTERTAIVSVSHPTIGVFRVTAHVATNKLPIFRIADLHFTQAATVYERITQWGEIPRLRILVDIECPAFWGGQRTGEFDLVRLLTTRPDLDAAIWAAIAAAHGTITIK